MCFFLKTFSSSPHSTEKKYSAFRRSRKISQAFYFLQHLDNFISVFSKRKLLIGESMSVWIILFAVLIYEAQPQKQERTAVAVSLLIPEIACANGVKKYVEMLLHWPFFSTYQEMTRNDWILAHSSESLCSAMCTGLKLCLTY